MLAYAALADSAAATARTAALKRPDPSIGPTRRFSDPGVSGISFRYPAGWRAESDPAFSFSFSALIVYLSNQRMHSLCVTTTTPTVFTKACGPPLSQLSSGSILASWWRNGRPTWPFKREARGMPLRVGGHRAKLRVTGAKRPITRHTCGLGADVMVDVVVDRADIPDN